MNLLCAAADGLVGKYVNSPLPNFGSGGGGKGERVAAVPPLPIVTNQ